MTLVAVLLMLAVGLWLFKPKTKPAPEPWEDREPNDDNELEAAEREVRDLDLNQRPDDGFEGDDWGPGTMRK